VGGGGVMDDPEAEAMRDAVAGAIYDIGNVSFTNRSRSYDGQPHTCEGTRGATMVSGLTFRDVSDCFRRAWLMAQGRSDLLDSADVSENDIYDGPDVDPIAVMQNMACEMERMMGIYPNVPPLESTR
jgi:hypothetical protein